MCGSRSRISGYGLFACRTDRSCKKDMSQHRLRRKSLPNSHLNSDLQRPGFTSVLPMSSTGRNCSFPSFCPARRDHASVEARLEAHKGTKSRRPHLHLFAYCRSIDLGVSIDRNAGPSRSRIWTAEFARFSRCGSCSSGHLSSSRACTTHMSCRRIYSSSCFLSLPKQLAILDALVAFLADELLLWLCCMVCSSTAVNENLALLC